MILWFFHIGAGTGNSPYGEGQWIQARFPEGIIPKRVLISDLFPNKFMGYINKDVELQWYDHFANEWKTIIRTAELPSVDRLYIPKGGMAYITIPPTIRTNLWRLYRSCGYLGTGLFSFA